MIIEHCLFGCFRGNPSDGCWNISMHQSGEQTDQQNDNAITRVLLIVWLKIQYVHQIFKIMVFDAQTDISAVIHFIICSCGWKFDLF